MEHIGTQIIETERLILRPVRMEDAPAAYRNWCSDNEVTKNLMWPTHTSVEVTEKVLADWVAAYEKKDFYLWVIELKELGEPIGTISAVKQDDHTKMVHIGYCIGKSWWNKGITSEALAAVMDFFFRQVGVNRIESRHNPLNPNSGKVMMHCGMRYEGTLRQADWDNSGICDTSYYAILAEEFESRGSQTNGFVPFRR
ncbi:MAG: GNAT family N-acetyltransferase [Oscillospiraceae bacterium]